jgi:hypothetical protein
VKELAEWCDKTDAIDEKIYEWIVKERMDMSVVGFAKHVLGYDSQCKKNVKQNIQISSALLSSLGKDELHKNKSTV